MDKKLLIVNGALIAAFASLSVIESMPTLLLTAFFVVTFIAQFIARKNPALSQKIIYAAGFGAGIFLYGYESISNLVFAVISIGVFVLTVHFTMRHLRVE